MRKLVLILLLACAPLMARAQPCSSVTGNNSSAVIIGAEIDGRPLTAADTVSVWTQSGVCAGKVALGGFPVALTLWGDDVFTEDVDGFVAGDTIVWVLYDSLNDIEIGRGIGSVQAELSECAICSTGPVWPGADAIFIVDRIRASEGSLAIVDQAKPTKLELEVFPNPSQGWVTVRSPGDWELYNVRGRELLRGRAGEYVLNLELSGLYLIRSGRNVAKVVVM